jgi:protoporphyrinogen oxidase
MDKKYYGGHHLTYFGNYLPPNHPYLSMTKEQLLKTFIPYIKRLSQNAPLKILNSFMFVGPYAQPVHELRYSSRVPQLTTSLPNVYLANIDSIIPWDRGTNYAVELGMRAAHHIMGT